MKINSGLQIKIVTKQTMIDRNSERDTTTKVAGVIVYNENNDILMVKGRHSVRGRRLWSFPKGHLEEGENCLQCAKREFTEETGRDFDGMETCIDTYQVGHCYFYVIKIQGQDLPIQCSSIDTNEILCSQWMSEDYLRINDNLNMSARSYVKEVIRPKYKRQKKIVQTDDDGWMTVN